MRVRSRKPRPQVLEHRLQGDHSSQAPCTAEGREGAAELRGHWSLLPIPPPRPLLPPSSDAPPLGSTARTLAVRPPVLMPRPPPASWLPLPRSCCSARPPGHTAELLHSRCSRRGPLHCVL